MPAKIVRRKKVYGVNIENPYLIFNIASLMRKVPKVRIIAKRIGNIIPPHRANAASGEMFASISAIVDSEKAGKRRIETKQINKRMVR